jgi:hypothetical protein
MLEAGSISHTFIFHHQLVPAVETLLHENCSDKLVERARSLGLVNSVTNGSQDNGRP